MAEEKKDDNVELDICTICMEPIGGGNVECIGPGGKKHKTHRECMKSWRRFKGSISCPVCRSGMEYLTESEVEDDIDDSSTELDDDVDFDDMTEAQILHYFIDIFDIDQYDPTLEDADAFHDLLIGNEFFEEFFQTRNVDRYNALMDMHFRALDDAHESSTELDSEYVPSGSSGDEEELPVVAARRDVPVIDLTNDDNTAARAVFLEPLYVAPVPRRVHLPINRPIDNIVVAPVPRRVHVPINRRAAVVVNDLLPIIAARRDVPVIDLTGYESEIDLPVRNVRRRIQEILAESSEED